MPGTEVSTPRALSAAGTVAGILLGLVLSLAGASSSYGQFAWQVFPVRQVAVRSPLASAFAKPVTLTTSACANPVVLVALAAPEASVLSSACSW